jgi:hypothetical protein
VWDVEATDDFALWFGTLGGADQERVAAAVEILAELGPGLGRPFVDTLKGSRQGNMKELRTRGGHLRVLFAFDPQRTAVLLVGGDKTDRWERWYADAITRADRLYDEHLADLRRGSQ